ncbi:hypothetical protein OAA99_01575 [Omnitrophica bacterium]|nr:hypothetical protein [Candidatus Omnitrophota bacterium]
MLGKISKALIGIILIPVVIGISISFFESLTGIGEAKNTGSKIFLLGALSYVIMHLFIIKPNYIYTLGHEIMHVVATWLCGGGVRSFKVTKEGGAVEATKSNTFINLSPYFVPTFTLILSILYFIIPVFLKIKNLQTIYFFAAGFTLALHLVFTADVLKREQPDIINTGYLFSLVMIYIVNVLLVGFILCLLFEGVSFEKFFYNTYIHSKFIYVKVFKQLFFL